MTETTPPADRAAILNEAADVLAALREKTDVNVAEYARYDFRQRIALSDGISRLRRMAVEAQQPASTAPLAANLPLVKGRCPACYGASLFLGDGGYVTCSRIDCPEPDAASTALEQPAVEAQQPETQGGCSQCGHRACMGRGRRCGVVMTSEAGIVRPPCQCLGAAVSQPGKEA
jgi:hypothetical protein